MGSAKCLISLVGGPADGLCIAWEGGSTFLYAAHEPDDGGGCLRPALYCQCSREPSRFIYTP